MIPNADSRLIIRLEEAKRREQEQSNHNARGGNLLEQTKWLRSELERTVHTRGSLPPAGRGGGSPVRGSPVRGSPVRIVPNRSLSPQRSYSVKDLSGLWLLISTEEGGHPIEYPLTVKHSVQTGKILGTADVNGTNFMLSGAVHSRTAVFNIHWGVGAVSSVKLERTSESTFGGTYLNSYNGASGTAKVIVSVTNQLTAGATVIDSVSNTRVALEARYSGDSPVLTGSWWVVGTDNIRRLRTEAELIIPQHELPVPPPHTHPLPVSSSPTRSVGYQSRASPSGSPHRATSPVRGSPQRNEASEELARVEREKAALEHRLAETNQKVAILKAEIRSTSTAAVSPAPPTVVRESSPPFSSIPQAISPSVGYQSVTRQIISPSPATHFVTSTAPSVISPPDIQAFDATNGNSTVVIASQIPASPLSPMAQEPHRSSPPSRPICRSPASPTTGGPPTLKSSLDGPFRVPQLSHSTPAAAIPPPVITADKTEELAVQNAAEEQAAADRLAAERRAAEAAEQQAAARKAEEAAIADRQVAEEKAAEEQRAVAEKQAVDDAERQAAENRETERIAAEKIAETKAQEAAGKKAAEEAQQAEAERVAAEEAKEAGRIAAEQKATEDEAAAEKAAAEDAERIAAEKKAAEEAEKQAAEEAEKAAAEEADKAAKMAAEEAVKEAAAKEAADEAEREAAEKKAADEAEEDAAKKAAQEAEKKAVDEAEREAAEKKAADEAEEEAAKKAAEEAEKKAVDEAEKEAATKKAAEEAEKEVAAKKAAEEAEKEAIKAAEEAAKDAADKKAAEEQKATEKKASKKKEELELGEGEWIEMRKLGDWTEWYDADKKALRYERDDKMVGSIMETKAMDLEEEANQLLADKKWVSTTRGDKTYFYHKATKVAANKLTKIVQDNIKAAQIELEACLAAAPVTMKSTSVAVVAGDEEVPLSEAFITLYKVVSARDPPKKEKK